MWILILGLAEAAENRQTLVYDLLLDGEPVGNRTVEIIYQEPVGIEATGRRKIDSMTLVKFEKFGQIYYYQQIL